MTILKIVFALISIILVCGVAPALGGLSITVAYDNSPFLEGATADWGFSCLIEIGRKKILFDTGKDSTILFSNISQLGIDLKTIDTIVISHLHLDHTGGLFPILERQPNATVFLPQSTPGMRQQFLEHRTKYISVEKPAQIGKGLFLTGALGQGIGEQALIINTPAGLIIVAGCSHPGIINIINRSKELLHRPVYLVIGGFHSMPKTAEGMGKIIRQFKSIGVRNVGPAHCTDEKVKAFFKAAYGKNYITVGAGKTLNFSTAKRK